MTRMFRLFISGVLGALLFGALPAHAASTFTQCLQLENPTPGDPAVTNSWGTRENNGRTLTDSAIAGALSLSVAGSSNVILTSTAGAPDQSRNSQYNFTGTLSGNITVFWPNALCRVFAVTNNTTGGFTLTLAVNNGSGAPAGSTVVAPSGQTLVLYDDGTNILPRFNGVPGNLTVNGVISGNGSGLTNIPAGSPTGAAGGDLAGNYPNPIVVASHFPGGLATSQGGTGVTDGSNLVPPCTVIASVALNAPAGYVAAIGQAVSRTGATANLFACSTISTTGNTHTTTAVDGLGTTTNMAAGMPICGPTIGANTTIAVVVSSTSITLSQAAIGSSNGVPIVVAPNGCGDGSTTFNVIDLRGRVFAGVDAGAGRLGNNTSAGGFAGTNFVGQAAGAQTHVQILAEMASHSHSVNITNESISPVSNDSGTTPFLPGWTLPTGTGEFNFGAQVGNATTAVSLNPNNCQVVFGSPICFPFINATGTAATQGSSAPATTTQPTVTGLYYVKL